MNDFRNDPVYDNPIGKLLPATGVDHLIQEVHYPIHSFECETEVEPSLHDRQWPALP